MTFQPSPLAHALAVVVAWIICLAIALDRVELFFVAIPLLVPMLRSPAPPRTVLRGADVATDSGPLVEGEELTVCIGACLEHAGGSIEIAPVLPLFLEPLTARRTAAFEFGGWLCWTRPATGPIQYRTLLQSLARITVNPGEFLQDLTRLPETMLPRRALVVALTPLADPRFTETVARLADHGHDAVLLAIRTYELCQTLVSRRLAHKPVQRLWLLEWEERLRELRGHGSAPSVGCPRFPSRARSGRCTGHTARAGHHVALIGLLTCLPSAAPPFAVQPDLHLLAAGAGTGSISAVGLLLPSLGLAVAGTIAAILVVSVALLIAPSEAPIIEAVLLGVALLNATYYRQRFCDATVAPSVRLTHLASLGMSVIASASAAVLLVALTVALPLGVEAWLHPLALRRAEFS